MFSLVVSVPYDKKTAQYDVISVKDDAQTVRNMIQKCDVYVGERVVAATVLKWPNVLEQCPGGPVQLPFLKKCRSTPRTWADVKNKCPPNTIRDGMANHAENRTLQKIDTLVSKHKKGSDDLLVFYILASPCDKRCTNEGNKWNILESIKSIKKWKNYAVVFTNVFQPRNGATIPEKEREEALKRLGKSVGLDNIFRCYKHRKNKMQCIKCSNLNAGNQVVDCRCYTWATTSFKTKGNISFASFQPMIVYKFFCWVWQVFCTAVGILNTGGAAWTADRHCGLEWGISDADLTIVKAKCNEQCLICCKNWRESDCLTFKLLLNKKKGWAPTQCSCVSVLLQKNKHRKHILCQSYLI